VKAGQDSSVCSSDGHLNSAANQIMSAICTTKDGTVHFYEVTVFKIHRVITYIE
jgi:hypothetical protein